MQHKTTSSRFCMNEMVEPSDPSQSHKIRARPAFALTKHLNCTMYKHASIIYQNKIKLAVDILQ
jgi:hypothetical protein